MSVYIHEKGVMQGEATRQMHWFLCAYTAWLMEQEGKPPNEEFMGGILFGANKDLLDLGLNPLLLSEVHPLTDDMRAFLAKADADRAARSVAPAGPRHEEK